MEIFEVLQQAGQYLGWRHEAAAGGAELPRPAYLQPPALRLARSCSRLWGWEETRSVFLAELFAIDPIQNNLFYVVGETVLLENFQSF